MVQILNYIFRGNLFFLLVIVVQKLAASDSFTKLSYDSQSIVFSFLWDKNNPETFCSHLVYFLMTNKTNGQLVDKYITQLFFKNEIDFSLIIADVMYKKLLMNSKLANFFIHKTPLHYFIDQTVNVQNKIIVLEKNNSNIDKSLKKINAFDLTNVGPWLSKRNDDKNTVKKDIFLLKKAINDAIQNTEEKKKDYTPLIMLGNEELKKLKKIKNSMKIEIEKCEKALHHHRILIDNVYFKEALQYHNVPNFTSNSGYFYWSSYKNIFYTKKNILEAFVIAKLIYQKYSIYKPFAEQFLIQAPNEVSEANLDKLLEKETIISGIYDFFNMHILPLIIEIDTEKTIDQLNLKKCFTITVLKHFYKNFYNTSLLKKYRNKNWRYWQKRDLLFFLYKKDFYITLPSLVITQSNDIVDINGDFLSKFLVDHLDDQDFCSCLINYCLPLTIRFSYLHECKHNFNFCFNDLCKKKIQKNIILKIDNGIAPFLSDNDNYISSANQRFLHEVVTNGYGNQISIQFEAPIHKMKEYQDAILKYKGIYYWLYYLNENIAENFKEWDHRYFSDSRYNYDHVIFLGVILLFYGLQFFYNILLNEYYYMSANSIFGILRTLFFLKKIVFPREIERNPIIPWYLIDVLMQDVFFLRALWYRDIDLVLFLQNIFYWALFNKSLFWRPFLRKIYYCTKMDDQKIMIPV